MTSISKLNIAKAVAAVRVMDIRQKELLADEVYANQPQLLIAVLAQQRFGSSTAQIEILLKLLLVSYEAMKVSNIGWEAVTEDMQERCLARLTGKVGFIDGLAPKQVVQAISKGGVDHKEKWLLAYVLDELGAHELQHVESDTQKYLVLTALNMVECIAGAGSTAM